MNRKTEGIAAVVLAGVTAVFYITGVPGVLFVDVKLADADPVCIALIINMCLIIALGIPLAKRVVPYIAVGFGAGNLTRGLRRYLLSCLLAFAVPCAAFAAGLMPFDYQPTIWKILIDGIIYYVGVGIVEEFFCRGLLLNGIAELLYDKDNAEMTAVILSSVIFGAGHIFGAAGNPPLIIACKIIWATGLGIYLGAVYCTTKSFWLTAGFHAFIDFCGLPFCFSTQKEYPADSAVIIMLAFLLLGIYGLRLMRKRDTKTF